MVVAREMHSGAVDRAPTRAHRAARAAEPPANIPSRVGPPSAGIPVLLPGTYACAESSVRACGLVQNRFDRTPPPQARDGSPPARHKAHSVGCTSISWHRSASVAGVAGMVVMRLARLALVLCGTGSCLRSGARLGGSAVGVVRWCALVLHPAQRGPCARWWCWCGCGVVQQTGSRLRWEARLGERGGRVRGVVARCSPQPCQRAAVGVRWVVRGGVVRRVAHSAR